MPESRAEREREEHPEPIDPNAPVEDAVERDVVDTEAEASDGQPIP